MATASIVVDKENKEVQCSLLKGNKELTMKVPFTVCADIMREYGGSMEVSLKKEAEKLWKEYFK